MENNKIIYKATNSVNGFVYVGATTKTIRDRKKDHLSKATSGESGKFQEAISTYGAEAFFWEQIDTASSIDELALKEKQYILESNSKEEGYNSDSGGGFKKTVYQYSIEDGRIVNSYDCLTDAGNVVNATKQRISSACLSVNNTYGGYFWSYEFKEPFIPTIDKRSKKVLQLNLEGESMNIFNSVAEASRVTEINKTGIAKVCRGERKKSGGYIWKYN